jgi:hypothetical protein
MHPYIIPTPNPIEPPTEHNMFEVGESVEIAYEVRWLPDGQGIFKKVSREGKVIGVSDALVCVGYPNETFEWAYCGRCRKVST